MQVPFTIQQFLDVFRDYNQAIWPAQIAAYLLGILCVIVLLARPRWESNFLLWTLAVLWVWNGLDYHWAFFRSINSAAGIFAAVFFAQALLLALYGSRRVPDFEPPIAARILGWAMILYAMAGYGILGYALGHRYPAIPIFGVAPCPTTLFTFGVLTLMWKSAPRMLLAIPAIWALVGTSAAVSLGMGEDFGLPVAALMAILLRLGHGLGNIRAASLASSGR